MKLKNVSLKVKNVKIKGEFVSIKPLEVADLPECLLVNEDGWEEEKSSVVEKEEKSSDKKDDEGKYSKTDLVDMKKEEQIKILRDFGVTQEKIKKLKNEEERVAHILELQK